MEGGLSRHGARKITIRKHQEYVNSNHASERLGAGGDVEPSVRGQQKKHLVSVIPRNEALSYILRAPNSGNVGSHIPSHLVNFCDLVVRRTTTRLHVCGTAQALDVPARQVKLSLVARPTGVRRFMFMSMLMPEISGLQDF